MWTKNFQMFRPNLGNAEEPEVKLLASIGSLKRKCSGKTCFIDYAKAFDCVYHDKLWKILQEMGIPDHFTCLLRNLQVKKQPSEPGMKQWTGSKLGKEYVKAIYCHPAYLTYMQSTSCKMLDWIKHKLESRLLGEISITSGMQIIPPLCGVT